MNTSFQRLLLLLALYILSKPLTAQDYVVNSTFLGSKSKIDLLILFGQNVDYAVDLYRITYKTLDIHNQPDTASGLLVLPQVPHSTLLPIVVYEHGTSSGPTDVPSQLRGGYEVALAYASFGFATLAPDYLGLGDARGFHPYLHAATEASASLDFLFAGYEFLETHDPSYDPNFLFIAGYSQGGHASAALHKLIDDYWSIIIPVTAATHMSGPYSMSGVMRDKLLSDESYGSPAYLAYIIMGLNQAYPLYNDIHEIFKEPFVTDIQKFYNGTINLTTLNSQLITELSSGGDTVAKRMLQDTVLASILANPDNRINLALKDNDLFNWAPGEPTRLYYCGADEQVPFRNSIVADSVMNELGAPDVKSENLNPTYGHEACVFPAVLSSIQFFLSFVHGTATKEISPATDELTFYPNPSFDMVNVDWANAKNGFTYKIFDTNGRLVNHGNTSSGNFSMSGLPEGLYMVVCSAGGETKMGRVLRQ
ncbi:MAG: T9SS type A sorting domain-containing protein [Saprospiraceae bacterium]